LLEPLLRPAAIGAALVLQPAALVGRQLPVEGRVRSGEEALALGRPALRTDHVRLLPPDVGPDQLLEAMTTRLTGELVDRHRLDGSSGARPPGPGFSSQIGAIWESWLFSAKPSPLGVAPANTPVDWQKWPLFVQCSSQTAE